MAEKEYIEREATLEAAKKSHLYFDLKPIIKSIHAADVRPVVHGHWITEEEAEERGNYSLRDACSVCGHCDWDCTESKGFNFCPNCGADMRETGNEKA